MERDVHRRVDAVAAPAAKLLIERNLAVPMRDGVVLRADVYLPETGLPVPAIVNRTPYDRTSPLIQLAAIEPERVVEAGLALVCQDVRGRFGSDGEFYTFFDDGRDSFDTVEWAAAQPWCDGSVGMVGRSYAAAVQWLGAAERPPHLKAISPIVTGSDYYRGWIYEGGAFQFGFNVFWIWLMSNPREVAKLEGVYRHLPLRTLPIDDLAWARLYAHWLAHSTDDHYWRSLSINRRYEQIEVPALIVGGWYDVFIRGTLENYAGMRDRGGSETARSGRRMIVGPWAHGSTYGPYPEHAFDLFGPDATIDVGALQLRFFARHLHGEENGLDDEPPVRIFVMWQNGWRLEDDGPRARASETRWYLRGGGRLTRDEPADEQPDQYVYDPHDPAPTIGGPTSLPARMMKMNSGPLDQSRLENRDDVLVYSSDVLEQPLEVTGPLVLVLHAATSATDTDLVAKLTDVRPDGSSVILAEGVLRARFRDGFDREVPVEPERPYDYRIDLGATSNVFLPGHRIRLLVTSSSFPRFDRNPNTGHPLGVDTEGDLTSARQTIFHDANRPSHLLLPVVR
jgi:putative CocE/NonD family hydrolase